MTNLRWMQNIFDWTEMPDKELPGNALMNCKTIQTSTSGCSGRFISETNVPALESEMGSLP